MSKIKVAVIFGGASGEHEISLISVTNVIQNLSLEKYEIICIGITKKGRWYYYPGDVSLIASGAWEQNPDCTPAVLSPDPVHKGFIKLDSQGETSIQRVDVILPILHGKNGEDGTIQGLFELSCIPHVGSGTLSSAACMDKVITHTILEGSGIQTARYRFIRSYELEKLDDKCEDYAATLKFPMFIKPANGGSSLGVNRANDVNELKDSIKLAFSHDKKVIIEEQIVGQEVECAVFGGENPIASVIGEIVPPNGLYDYESKYISNEAELYIPARINPKYSEKIREIAIRAFKAMGCTGLARVDFFLTKNGSIILNEINTLPGFTQISMYPKLMEYTGMSYEKLLDNLIDLAINGG